MLLKTWIYPRPSIFIRFISDKIFRICPVGYRESPLTDVCTPPYLKWRTSGTLVGGDALNPGTLAALRVPGYGRVSSLRDDSLSTSRHACHAVSLFNPFHKWSSLRDEVSTIALWRFFAAVCANNNKFGR